MISRIPAGTPAANRYRQYSGLQPARSTPPPPGHDGAWRPGECRVAILLLLCAVAPLPSIAAEKRADRSILTLDRIYHGGEFDAEGYSARWLSDRPGYTRLEKSKETGGGQDIVRYDPMTGDREILVPAADLVPAGSSEPLAIDDYAWSRDFSKVLIYTESRRVWRQNTRGDYWVLDRSNHVLHQLGGDAKPSTLMFAKFSPSGHEVAYVREGNIYLEDLRDHQITPLTTSDSPEIINGTFDWVYEEELGLRDGFRWSPDSRSIAYWQLNTKGVRQFPLVNNTDGLYPEITNIRYPKAGQQNSACRIGVVDIGTTTTRWIKVPGEPRDHYIARMEWAESSDEILLQQLNRLQNTNRLMLANVQTGQVDEILTERDPAWVDVHDELKWLDGGRQFTWISERDGWRHAYLANRSGEAVDLITPGDYDVIELLRVDSESGWCYFLASPDNPTQRYLYRIRLCGSDLRRLTPADQHGTHTYQISPDARWALHTYSSFDTPPVTQLVSLPEHKTIRVLAKNQRLRRNVRKLERSEGEFFRVDIGRGVELDGWCIKPPDFDPGTTYPLLVYVYGEPAGQTVLDRWGGKNYLWHLMLAQHGCVIMSFDNRGTPAPRGRAWRKTIYRQVGILAPQDQAAAVQAVLEQRPYLDRNRIGVWGWSGGGSMSLNAIFKFPQLYQTAIAVAPVSNERYYDTIYQERYMGLPSDNVDGYLNGSPINFAHQLEGELLLIHGTGDDNCHYQGTEALINKLIRHNKQFSMMAYPNRSHSIREGKNTTRHLRQLMTDFLEDHLSLEPTTGQP